MLPLDATWLDNISKRIWPTPLLVIRSAGFRVYSNRDVSDITASVFGPTEGPVISFENRVKSFGTIEKKIFDFATTIVQGFSKKTLQVSTVVLNNSDHEISALVNSERWHNKTFEIYLAYANSTAKLKIFEGVIQDIFFSLKAGTATLKATESGYDQVFTPVRAGNLNVSTLLDSAGFVLGSNDELPVVYGEVNGPSTNLPNTGAWKVPYLGFIALNAFYGYAGHETIQLSSSVDNVPRVWVNGEETTIFTYTPNSTLFQTPSGNNIALIETSAANFDDSVTVRGKGKAMSTSSTVLMENIVDIITDFIQVENSSVFQIDPTNQIDSKTFIDSTSFDRILPPGKFAGTITKEVPVWTQIQEMLSGLGGTAFLSSDDGELKFVIDKFMRNPDGSLIISRGDILDTQTISRVKNIYNSVKGKAAWFETTNSYQKDFSALTRATSVENYGTREVTLTSKWSFSGDDVFFLRSEFTFSGDGDGTFQPLDIITCLIANPVIMQIEPGLDYLYLTFENLIGTDGEVKINEFCKVLSMKFLLDQNKVQLTVLDTNQWKDDGAGNRDMTIY